MRSGMIAFSLGVVAVGVFPGLPSDKLLGFLVTLNIVMLLWLVYRARNECRWKLLPVFVYGIAFYTGVIWHIGHAEVRISERLPTAMEGEDFLVSGLVSNLPQARGVTQQFRFTIETSSSEFQPRTVLLNYYGGEVIEAGQRWQFQVRLNRPHGFLNPGGFDYEAWLFQQDISAKGYVRTSDANRLLDVDLYTIVGFRQLLKKRICALTDGLPQQGIILALTLGDRSLLSDDHWQAFTATGTNHLVVVSGLHIGFVASICYLVGIFGWRRFPFLMLFLPSQKAGAIAAIAGAAMYSLVAGFSMPTQRALVMVSVFMLAKLLSVRQSPSFTFLLSLVAVLLLDPFASLSVGFWLSFVAVAALLLVFSSNSKEIAKPSAWLTRLRWGKAQVTVFVALLVPLSLSMGQVSLLSPIANSFAIPLVSWIVVPLCLLACTLLWIWPDLSQVLFEFANLMLVTMLHGLNWISSLEVVPATWQFQFTSSWLALSISLACVLILLPGSGYLRILSVLLMLPLLFPRLPLRTSDRLELHVLDVGQGLASIVRTRDHVLVYDTGAAFAGGFDSGKAILAPALLALGIAKIDTLIISHGDNDHAGGAAGLIESIEVSNLLSSVIELSFLPPAQPCEKDQQWEWDSVQFRMLHPQSVRGLSNNNSSCVLQVRFGSQGILLPGDIEAAVEQQLVNREGGNLASNVLIAAHHGSNSSSTARFIAAVDPEIVVFSAGYRNQFRHPTEAVQARFHDAGIQSFNTATDGMISVYLSNTGRDIDVSTYRESRRRYWN